MSFALLAALLVHAAAPPTVEEKIDRLLESTPAAARAHIGIYVVNLRNGQPVYAMDEDRLFTPASNTKLFSTAVALMRLGGGYRFQTRLLAASTPDSTGVIYGDLTLAGGGDPSFCARGINGNGNGKGGLVETPLKALEEFADQAYAAGIRRIRGNIVGDDTHYPYQPYPPGWSQDDEVFDYGGPVSALMVNDGAIAVTIRPGAAAGDPAEISIYPPIEYFTIENHIITSGPRTETRIEVDRPQGTRLVELRGNIRLPAKNTTSVSVQVLSMDDPALYAAAALLDALTRRGIAVDGHPVARHRSEPGPAKEIPGVVLASVSSPPLLEIVRVADKISQNLYAELLLRAAGNSGKGDGSRESGVTQLAGYLSGIGVEPDSYYFQDGSGLSNLTLVSPKAIVKLLSHMYESQARNAWIGVLPIGGEDGTLKGRFPKEAAKARRIHAKTGTISHVSALSGYVEGGSAERGPLAFSILVNHYKVPASEVRQLIDKIGLALVEAVN